VDVKIDPSHLREGQRFRAFESRVPRKVLGQQRERSREAGENYIMRNFTSCTFK
jgi:hypothetical protein